MQQTNTATANDEKKIISHFDPWFFTCLRIYTLIRCVFNCHILGQRISIIFWRNIQERKKNLLLRNSITFSTFTKKNKNKNTYMWKMEYAIFEVSVLVQFDWFFHFGAVVSEIRDRYWILSSSSSSFSAPFVVSLVLYYMCVVAVLCCYVSLCACANRLCVHLCIYECVFVLLSHTLARFHLLTYTTWICQKFCNLSITKENELKPFKAI